MKTFAAKEQRSAPAAHKARPYIHHPIGPVQQAQQAEIRRILRSTGAQAKLTIGQPNDKYEQEADRVADQVMRMSDADVAQRQPENEEEEDTLQAKPLADQITPLVQRQEESPEKEEPVQAKLHDGEMLQRICAECEEETVQRQPEENEDEEIQAKSEPGEAPSVTPSLESRINSLQGGGQPLDPATRSFFEPRFGHDFSQVRVHTDSNASETAKSVNAKAFTLGGNMVFGSNEYQPRSTEGKILLAHELTHTIQQSQSGRLSTASVAQRLGNPADIPNAMNCPDAITDELRSRDSEVTFSVGDFALTGAAATNIATFAGTWIAGGSTQDMIVHGFASQDGDQGPNWQLSCDRALAVQQELVINGVPADRIIALAHGETTAFSPTSNRPNRRAVVTLVPTTPVAVPSVPGTTVGAAANNFLGITFALANQTGSGRNPGARRRGVLLGGGISGIRVEALGPVNYTPTVTITVPLPLLASASDFEVGLIGNLLNSTRDSTYSNGHLVRITVPFFPIKDGVSATDAQFDDVYLRTGAPIRGNFINSGDTVNLSMDDAPGSFAFVNLQDDPICAAGAGVATLTDMEINDSFRTWVAVRHIPSGSVLALHHIDWESDWQLAVAVGGGGAITAAFTVNTINVTQPNGNGSPAFVSGARVPNDLHVRTC